jgi:hypothetical protein
LMYINGLLMIAILIELARQNAYIGFGVYLFIVLLFAVFTINEIDKEDIEFERRMLRNKRNRRLYYNLINSQ